MDIVFRADASEQIGTGHVMRCLALADYLSANGAKCYFITKELERNLITLIEEKAHNVFRIKPDLKSYDRSDIGMYESWLGSSQISDANSSIEHISGLNPHWIVVDNYSLDKTWEKLLKPYCSNLLVIDDLANRSHECDLLIDQTVLRNQNCYKDIVNANCRLLCGSNYALLRPEFLEWRIKSINKSIGDLPFRILLNLGGIDQNDVTSKVIDSLRNCDLPANTEITVVMGSKSPYIYKVTEKIKLLSYPSIVYSGISNMAEVMSKSHICIGAAGSSSWERCCVGLPSITIAIADNQLEIARNLQRCGAGIIIKIDDVMNNLNTAINDLIKNWDLYRAACFEVSDGTGCSRVVQAMEDIAGRAQE